jgi:hypothetical protein
VRVEGSPLRRTEARRRRCLKLATATASAAKIGIREQYGMKGV